MSPPLLGDVDVLAPLLRVGDVVCRVRLLDIGAMPVALLAAPVASAKAEADAIMNALDILLRGYPVGMPR